MSKTKKYKTGFLYGKRNAIIGAGSIFNIAGNYFEYNYSKNGREADNKAIESDWMIIGNDLKEAFKTESASISATTLY